MTQTIHHSDAGLPFGRGTKGCTLKELKAQINRYVEKKGLKQSKWLPRSTNVDEGEWGREKRGLG
jgi:hypothetical protein